MKVKDILHPESVSVLECYHTKETTKSTKLALEQLKDRDIESLTLKEIRTLTPLFLSQSAYCCNSEDYRLYSTVQVILHLSNKGNNSALTNQNNKNVIFLE